MKEKLYDLYYSSSQAKMKVSMDFKINIFIDEHGNKRQYTEAVRHGEKPSGSWDDYIFVGSKKMVSS